MVDAERNNPANPALPVEGSEHHDDVLARADSPVVLADSRSSSGNSLEMKQQHIITSDGRVRYLERRDGELVWVYPQTGEIEPIKIKAKRGVFKRTLLAFTAPVLLFVFAGIMLAFVGDTGVEKLNQTINQLWFKAAIFRVVLYAVISFAVFPLIVRTAKARAQDRMAARRYVLFAEDATGAAYAHAMQQIEEQEAKIQCFRVSGAWCFLGLLVFDALVVHLPFLIK